jgi:hypothetical protein
MEFYTPIKVSRKKKTSCHLQPARQKLLRSVLKCTGMTDFVKLVGRRIRRKAHECSPENAARSQCNNIYWAKCMTSFAERVIHDVSPGT